MDAKQKIISYYVDELNKRNFAVLNDVVADKVIIDSKSITRDEYKKIIDSRIAEFPDYQVKIKKMNTKGDVVVLSWERIGTSAKTGEKLREELRSEYRIIDERICEVR